MEKPTIITESRNTRMRDKRRREGWKRIEVWLPPGIVSDLNTVQIHKGGTGSDALIWCVMAATELLKAANSSDKQVGTKPKA